MITKGNEKTQGYSGEGVECYDANTDYAKISSDNIKYLLIKNHMSIRRLAEQISIAPTTLNDALKSKKGVAIDALIKVSGFFHITVNDLCDINFSEHHGVTADSDLTIMKKYCLLNKHGKELVSMIIDKELDRMINPDD